MILSQDAKTIFNDCNHMRGTVLAADKFETSHFNQIAPGEQIHGFIVAPAVAYSAASPSGQKMEYRSYSVFAIDRKTLQNWQEPPEKNLHGLFNKNSKTAANNSRQVFPTHSAAHAQARQLNQREYNEYLKDYQTGRHAGIRQWQETPVSYGKGAGAVISAPSSSAISSAA